METCPQCGRATNELIDCSWCNTILCEPCLDKHDCPDYPPDNARKAIEAMQRRLYPEGAQTQALTSTLQALRIMVDALEAHVSEKDDEEAEEAFQKIISLLSSLNKKT